MSATLSPLPLFRAFTAAGAPLAGGKLWTYAAGTSTPLATYTDATGAVTAPNPIVLDANGQAPLWLGYVPYKLNLLDASNVQQPSWPIDPVTVYDAATAIAASTAGVAAAIQNQTYQAFTTAGSAPNFTLSPSPAIGTLANGQEFEVTFNSAGTTGSNTLNVSGKGAKNLKQYDSAGVKQPAIIASSMIAKVRYDGVDMVVLTPLSSAVIDNTVSVARTFYVRTDGNDTNDGSANDAAHAFKTIQKGVDVVALKILYAKVTIQVGDGTYPEKINLKPWNGNVPPLLRGNFTTPANCIIQPADSYGIQANTFTSGDQGTFAWEIGGFKIFGAALTPTSLILMDGAVTIAIVGLMELGYCYLGSHFSIGANSTLNIRSNYTINDAATQHFYVNYGGKIYFRGADTVTVTGTPTFTTFAYAYAGSLISATVGGTITFSGSATGTRYYVAGNSVISVGGGATYFPGGTAGVTATGGQYV